VRSMFLGPASRIGFSRSQRSMRVFISASFQVMLPVLLLCPVLLWKLPPHRLLSLRILTNQMQQIWRDSVAEKLPEHEWIYATK
jgi:hypothetical protein